jgi:hypothetical protein
MAQGQPINGTQTPTRIQMKIYTVTTDAFQTEVEADNLDAALGESR